MEDVKIVSNAGRLVDLFLCVLDVVESRAVAKPEFYDAEQLKQDFHAGSVLMEAREGGAHNGFTKSVGAQLWNFLYDGNPSLTDEKALGGASVDFWAQLPGLISDSKKSTEELAGATLRIYSRQHSLVFERLQEIVGHRLEPDQPQIPHPDRFFEVQTHPRGNQIWRFTMGGYPKIAKGSFELHPDGTLAIAQLLLEADHG